MTRKLNTLDDLQQRLRQDSEYRQQERLLRPIYDLMLAIIKRRNALGLSQKELAEKAGTYQSRISKIESAEHDIRLSTLTQIAEALETKVVIQLEPFTEMDYEPSESDYHPLFQARVKTAPCIETNISVEQDETNFSVIAA